MSIGLRVSIFAFVGAVLAFLVVPTLAVIPASFNHASYIQLPPEAVSLRWYAVLLHDREWLSSFLVSVKVATIATTLSLLLGAGAAFGLERLPESLRNMLFGFFLAPLIVPTIITAIALYYIARPLGLIGTIVGLGLGHTVQCLPFVIVNVGVSLKSLDSTLLRAAEGLGASPLRAFCTITLPTVLPGLAGAAVFAFITSFDEVVLSVFLSGVDAKTMPVKMWETIRVEFTPVTAVAATFLITIALVLFLIVQFIRWRSQRVVR